MRLKLELEEIDVLKIVELLKASDPFQFYSGKLIADIIEQAKQSKASKKDEPITQVINK
jgi:hypothetical protein